MVYCRSCNSCLLLVFKEEREAANDSVYPDPYSHVLPLSHPEVMYISVSSPLILLQSFLIFTSFKLLERACLSYYPVKDLIFVGSPGIEPDLPRVSNLSRPTPSVRHLHYTPFALYLFSRAKRSLLKTISFFR
jgi:hypothetical protein